jgi:hypothetical protein
LVLTGFRVTCVFGESDRALTLAGGRPSLGVAPSHVGGVFRIVVVVAADGFFQLIKQPGAARMGTLLALNAQEFAGEFVMKPIVTAHLTEHLHFGFAENEIIVKPLARIGLARGFSINSGQAVFHFVLLDNPKAADFL